MCKSSKANVVPWYIPAHCPGILKHNVMGGCFGGCLVARAQETEGGGETEVSGGLG